MFEAIGAFNAGKISLEQFMDVEDHACPGAGACGGQFTANTMATAYEMLGMSPMGWNDIPATDPRKEEVAFESGKLVMELVRKGLTPRKIVTRKSFENSIAGVMATGGSTNAVLHLMATARDFGVKLAIEDFDRISRKTPVLADLKPWGNYTAPEMYDAGGMAVVGKRLLEARLGSTRSEKTVTGRSIGEEVKAAAGARGAEGDQAARPGAQARGRHRDPARQPGPGRLRDQALRPEEVLAPRTRAGLRGRGGRLRGHQEGQDQAQRRDRDPLRGPQGRPRACARCCTSPARCRARGWARAWP